MNRAQLKKKVNEMTLSVAASANAQSSVYGIVSHSTGEQLKAIKKVDGVWREVDESPQIFIAESLEPLITRPKRFNIIIGGRGSGKSLGVGDVVCTSMNDDGDNWFCLREFQSSIEDSVHGLLKKESQRLGFEPFNVTDTTITSATGGKARFAGLARNSQSVKSAFGFQGYWVEEAQNLSDKSLQDLTPTARNEPKSGLPKDIEKLEADEDKLKNVKMVFTANPQSSEDAFSKLFITPFLDVIERDGVYEDELHLIIKMNYNHNPWYRFSGLEGERAKDFRLLPRAYYDHKWLGAFNDSVENAIIPAEWFDACIDAHVKLGFKPKGFKSLTHDPSDVGDDAKAACLRHGSVILDVQEKLYGDVNEGCDWAIDYAIAENVDQFKWDIGGMGVGLKRQVEMGLDGKRIEAVMFNGGASVTFPEKVYNPTDGSPIKQQKKNKDVFKNLRSQNYWMLRDKIYNTYRAVSQGEYINPDDMISFSSEIKNMNKLRSEICRLPLKPNVPIIQIMSKPDMLKMGIPSPNMADCVMMSENYTIATKKPVKTSMPPTKRTMRNR